MKAGLLLAIMISLFMSLSATVFAATGTVRTVTGKPKRFAYTGSTTQIFTGGAYFRDAGTYSNSMLNADGVPNPSGTLGANIHYVDRNNSGGLDLGTDSIVYCLQYRKASPAGTTFSTDTYNAASYASQVTKDSTTNNGLILILQNGYPVKTAAEMGLADNDAAYYATAGAIRFWLARRERDLNFYPWHYNFLDLSRGVGTIAPIAGQEAVWNKAVQLHNLAVTNTGQRSSSISTSAVGSDTYRYDYFIYQYKVNLINMNGGYQVTSTSLPSGSLITGFTGKSGDVLNVKIPFTAANAGKSFSLVVTGYDSAQAGSLEKYLPTSGSYQGIAGFNLNIVSTTKTATISGTTRLIPDLIVESMSTDKSTYDSGDTGTLNMTVLNQGNGSTGLNSTLWLSTFGKSFTVGNLAAGGRATFSTTFSVPGPYTSNVTFDLNATADNSNAVVESNESNNSRSFNVTIRGKADLTISSLTTDKVSYDPGETVVVQATVSNNSSIAAPAFNIRFRSPLLGDIQWLRGNGLAANSSQVFTFSFAAPSTFAADTVLTLEALADASDEIGEFREDNNSAALNFAVRALLPDLTGLIATDKPIYEAGETITVTFSIRNDGALPVSGFNSRWLMRTLGLPAEAQGQLDVAATSSISAFSSIYHTVSFTAPSRTVASTLQIELDLDYDNRINELDEGNNLIQHQVAVNEIQSDLSIVSDNISTYLVDKDVVIAAKIHNQSQDPLAECPVRLEFGSQKLNGSIPIPAFNDNLAVFRVRTPSVSGSYTIQITVDPDNLIGEGDESNNLITKAVTIGPEQRNPMPDPDTPALEQQFKAYGKAIPALSIPTSSMNHTWQEYRLENGNYVLKNFWMRLATTFEAFPDPRIAIAGSPDLMESGFGLAVNATTAITTNYDRPEKLVGPQLVYCFYPEANYGLGPFNHFADALVPTNGFATDFNLIWHYPASPFSTIGSRLHFTPLWIPDGIYPVLKQVFYAWSPVGQLYDYSSDPVTIQGDMYDRVTAVRR
jgi:subtilase family serine protease